MLRIIVITCLLVTIVKAEILHLIRERRSPQMQPMAPMKPMADMSANSILQNGLRQIAMQNGPPQNRPQNGGYSQNPSPQNPAPQNGGYSSNPVAQNGGYSSNPVAQNGGYSSNPVAQNGGYSSKPIPQNITLPQESFTGKDVAKTYVDFANRESARVNAHMNQNWDNKLNSAKEVENAGARAKKQGEHNAKKIAESNRRAIGKALTDIELAQALKEEIPLCRAPDNQVFYAS